MKHYYAFNILNFVIILITVYFSGKCAVQNVLNKKADSIKSIIKESTLMALKEYNDINKND